jgi:hypothetical protein
MLHLVRSAEQNRLVTPDFERGNDKAAAPIEIRA